MVAVADTLTARAHELARLRHMAAGFSRHVLGRPLYGYQLDIIAAVLESIHANRGTTFTVMLARQMGKNELSAHLEAMLLTRFAPKGATIVKAAPTFRPQVTTSLQRLELLLNLAQQKAPLERIYKDGRKVTLKPRKTHSHQIEVGDARIAFLSADPNASVVGATASLLLEIDEAQDVDPDKFARDFRPMAAANNATTVLYGTAWTQDTLLEQQKQINLRLEAEDGIQRHFEFDWRAGAAVNPSYDKFVRAQIQERSVNDPLIRTQYLLLPHSEAGAFFAPELRALLHGDHPRQTVPTPEDQLPEGTYYVAGIDIAGAAEESVDLDHLVRAKYPRKDSTVVLIAEVTRPNRGQAGEPHPETRIVEAYWWTGRPLHEQCDTLVSILKEWRCRRAVIDASGIGADLAMRVQRALGERLVEPFLFTVSSKSELAYALLAHAGSTKLQMWEEHVPGMPKGDASFRLKLPRLPKKTLGPASQGFAALSPEAAEFWREVERARPIHRTTGSGMFGANKLSFYVPAQYGHDDYLNALALLSRAACSAVLATPYVPTVIIPPAPTEWELEEQHEKIAAFNAEFERSFYDEFRRTVPPTPAYRPPAEPPDPEGDRIYRSVRGPDWNVPDSDPSPPARSFPFRDNPAYGDASSHPISMRGDVEYDRLPPGTDHIREVRE